MITVSTLNLILLYSWINIIFLDKDLQLTKIAETGTKEKETC